jgi:hypothetical protein
MRAYFLYERVHILLTDRKHLHDLIILLRGGRVSVHKTSLIPPLFIEMPVPNQESEQSWLCMCVLGVSIVSLSIICAMLSSLMDYRMKVDIITSADIL